MDSGSAHGFCVLSSHLPEHQAACRLHVKNIGHASCTALHMVSRSQRLTLLLSFGLRDNVATQTAASESGENKNWFLPRNIICTVKCSLDSEHHNENFVTDRLHIYSCRFNLVFLSLVEN